MWLSSRAAQVLGHVCVMFICPPLGTYLGGHGLNLVSDTRWSMFLAPFLLISLPSCVGTSMPELHFLPHWSGMRSCSVPLLI